MQRNHTPCRFRFLEFERIRKEGKRWVGYTTERKSKRRRRRRRSTSSSHVCQVDQPRGGRNANPLSSPLHPWSMIPTNSTAARSSTPLAPQEWQDPIFRSIIFQPAIKIFSQDVFVWRCESRGDGGGVDANRGSFAPSRLRYCHDARRLVLDAIACACKAAACTKRRFSLLFFLPTSNGAVWL